MRIWSVSIYFGIPCLILIAISAENYIKFKHSNSKFIISETSTPVLKEALRVSRLIRNCGFTCMRGQYFALTLAVSILIPIVYMYNPWIAFGITVGYLCNLSLAFVSFDCSTIANIVTAIKSITTGNLEESFDSAYQSGRITSLIMATLIVIIYISYVYYLPRCYLLSCTIGSAIGGSLVALFSRLAGGIFTKSADVAADMIAKVLSHLPEDSPENPGVIADNIGDNIGDCVGTANDIFESFLCSLILLAALPENMCQIGLYYLCIPVGCSLFATYVTRLKNRNVKGVVFSVFRSVFISAPCVYLISTIVELICRPAYLTNTLVQMIIFLIGIGLLISILLLNNYYVSKNHNPVKSIAESANKGAAMNMISGLTVGFEATAIIVSVLGLSSLCVFFIYGLNGLFLLLLTLIGFTPAVMTLDGYGPVVDNAGGIVVMAGAPASARAITDELDCVGNLTKSLSKGYSSCVTVLTVCIIASYYVKDFNILSLIGCALGSTLAFGFAGQVINAVHKGAEYMLHKATAKMKNSSPKESSYYTSPIGDLAKKSVQYSLPALTVLVIPIAIYALGTIAGLEMKHILLGNLVGVLASASNLALFMTISGAAWDNAKKVVEALLDPIIESTQSNLGQALSKLTSVSPVNLDTVQISAIVTDMTTKSDKQADQITAWRASLTEFLALTKLQQETINTNSKHCQDLQGIVHQITNYALDKDADSDAGSEIFLAFKDIINLRAVRTAAATGDIVGDPFKDAAGVSLHSLMKIFTGICVAILTQAH